MLTSTVRRNKNCSDCAVSRGSSARACWSRWRSFCCPTCNHVTPIFGHGGARAEAESRGIPYLGEIPLDMQIRQTSDDGRPIVAIEPDGIHARHYIGIAREIWTAIVTGAAHRPPPRIVIE
jgi:ATP-binding protein involved in chromosome partitioning